MDIYQRRLRRGWILAFTFVLALWAVPSRGQDLSQKADYLHFNNPFAEAIDRSGGLECAGPTADSSASSSSAEGLEVTWRTLPRKFSHNEKDMWLFATKAAEGKNWSSTAITVGGSAGAPFSDSARCQTGSFEALPWLRSPVEGTVQIPAGGSFDITTLPPGIFERDARGGDRSEQGATGSSPQPQIQNQQSGHQGLVMRSVKRTLEDQKELYRAPLKPSNFKWDALVLGGTAALIATDRHIENHIPHAHYTFYQDTSNIAIAGLGATLGGVWIWGLKGDHPHAKETGVLELETLVNTFLIYTPMQLLAARQRPDVGNGNGDFWRHHSINTSFPGGHAMFTYAMSTVVSHEYPQKWVQALAYSAATIVTVTRFMARDHWSSDMFTGAALGIGIGAHVFHAHCNPELSDSCKHHVRWIF